MCDVLDGNSISSVDTTIHRLSLPESNRICLPQTTHRTCLRREGQGIWLPLETLLTRDIQLRIQNDLGCGLGRPLPEWAGIVQAFLDFIWSSASFNCIDLKFGEIEFPVYAYIVTMLVTRQKHAALPLRTRPSLKFEHRVQLTSWVGFRCGSHKRIHGIVLRNGE